MFGVDCLVVVNELFYCIGKDYEKFEWGINEIDVDGECVLIVVYEEVNKLFCKLLCFKCYSNEVDQLYIMFNQFFVLVVVLLFGYYVMLLCDIVCMLLCDYCVYVIDWIDVCMVLVSEGEFGLDDYIVYIQEFICYLGVECLYVVSVCQLMVLVLVVVLLMVSCGELMFCMLVMMGGLIDVCCSLIVVNNLVMQNLLLWFENNVIYIVLVSYFGVGCCVYFGFL